MQLCKHYACARKYSNARSLSSDWILQTQVLSEILKLLGRDDESQTFENVKQLLQSTGKKTKLLGPFNITEN